MANPGTDNLDVVGLVGALEHELEGQPSDNRRWRHTMGVSHEPRPDSPDH